MKKVILQIPVLQRRINIKHIWIILESSIKTPFKVSQRHPKVPF